jgi:hypothetical protein
MIAAAQRTERGVHLSPRVPRFDEQLDLIIRDRIESDSAEGPETQRALPANCHQLADKVRLGRCVHIRGEAAVRGLDLPDGPHRITGAADEPNHDVHHNQW